MTRSDMQGKVSSRPPPCNSELEVYVIIPVYNRKEFTRRCLNCLRSQTYRKITVVVVDDASTDGTGEMLQAEYPEVVRLVGTGDLWWTGGTNLGLRWALQKAGETDALLLLNNDLTFDAGWLESLVRTHNQYPSAVIASVESSMEHPDRLLAGARRVNWWTGKQKKLHQGMPRSAFPAGHVEPGDYVTGRGVLYPCKCIRDIGLVNPVFRHIGDYELGVRAAKRGYRLLYCYDAVVYHQPDDQKGINAGPSRLRDLWRYYTDRRSYACMRNIFWNALLCTRNPLQALTYFTCSIARTAGHFVRNLAAPGAGGARKSPG